MKKTWMDRAKSRMQDLGITHEMLARSLGMTRGAVGHYLAGRRPASLRQLERIAKQLTVHPSWLLYGNTIMEVHEEAAAYGTAKGRRRKIPVTGTASTGPVDAVEAYINMPSPSADSYALTVTTSEYSPRLYEGEAILINPDLKPAPGDEVIVKLISNDDAHLYELLNIRGKKFTFNNLSGQKQRTILNSRDIEYIHCITAVIRVTAIERT